MELSSEVQRLLELLREYCRCNPPDTKKCYNQCIDDLADELEDRMKHPVGCDCNGAGRCIYSE